MAYGVVALENLAELKNRRGNATSTTLATILGLNYPLEEAYSVYWWNDTSTETPDDIEIVNTVILPNLGRWYKIELDQAPQINSDWNAVSGSSQILNKPTLSTVATSGSYSDLIGKPTIPSSQVNSDWNSINGVSQVLNKPDLSVYYLNSNPSGYITGINSGMINTALGYTPYNSSNPAGYLSSINSAQVIAALGYTPYNNANSAGYITSSSTNTLTNKSGLISQWTNDIGYLTTINSGQITSALGYTPYNGTTNPSGFLTGITSGQVSTALGYTPLTSARTITINGTALDLTSNRSWSVGDILSTSTYSDPSWITSLAYSKLTGTPTIPSTTSQITEGTNLYFTTTRARAAISQGTGISYNSTTGVISATSVAPSYNNAPTVTLNTSKQISTTRNARVSYTVAITTAITLLNLNSAGQAFLEISVDNSTWITINSAGIARTLAVSISVGLNDTSYFNIQGEVPAGYYVRIRTTTSGGGTVSFTSGQEVQY